VNDAERLAKLVLRFVCRVEAVQDARHDRARHSDRNTLAPFEHLRLEVIERLARDVLHDDPEIVAFRDDVESRHHVRVVDPPDDASLVEEALHEHLVLRVAGVEDLDGYGAGESARPDQAAQMHRSHPPRADLRVDGVPSPARLRGYRAHEDPTRWHSALASVVSAKRATSPASG